MARARSRRASPSGNSAKASRRRAMNFVVAMVSASRRNGSRERAPARSRKGVVSAASLTRWLPSSTSARWRARTREPRRRSPPPICMRQPASQATTQSAPVASMLASFLSRIAEDTSGRRTEKEPPKPQHSSLPGSSTKSAPRRRDRMRPGTPSLAEPAQEVTGVVIGHRPGTALVNSVRPSTWTRNWDSS